MKLCGLVLKINGSQEKEGNDVVQDGEHCGHRLLLRGREEREAGGKEAPTQEVRPHGQPVCPLPRTQAQEVKNR